VGTPAPSAIRRGNLVFNYSEKSTVGLIAASTMVREMSARRSRNGRAAGIGDNETATGAQLTSGFA
jgi:hypothetical protein